MPQSLFCNFVHIVFSTKSRQPFLTPEVRPRMHAYMAGILRNLKCFSVIVGGTEDHVHIGCNLTKFRAPVEVLETVKKDSSKWVKTLSPTVETFQWQRGYGLFSISPSKFEAVRQYIANQDEHHRNLTFQEEFRALLQRYNVEFDERYVWD
ncbi:MAG: transposase [Armatimonadetes bacterium CG2_30_59_28]|nr:MAG: transposase [Armatimonadetes bacterium CG2_30_59_28]